MMRALVVDGEDLPRCQLCRMLSEHGDFEIAECRNGIEAMERIAEQRPDVMFLDIEMPGMTGFELLENLREPPAVVIVSAYDEYAIKAFEANALDYLLKPVGCERLARTVSRLRGALRESDGGTTRMRRVVREMQGAPARIAVRKQQRIVLLSVRTVLWAGVEQRLVFVHTATERYLSGRTIGELDGMLRPASFYRINRSEIVNLEHVQEIAPWTSGTYRLMLGNGMELSVSRDRVPQFKALIAL